MKRAPFVIAGTAAGLGLLLSFHTKPVTVNLGTAIGSSSAKSTSKTAVATGSSSSRSSKSSSSASKTGSSTTSSSAPSKSSAAGATRSAVGAAVNYNYGVVAVKVTASGSRVTDVTIASLNDGGNFRSVSIDEAAIPTLEQEALSAQNANIQGVSGATYTSAGFAQSLQSALKKLGM